ncbi:MAG: hypothetical protein QNL70_01415 [Pseudomonas sp.]
MGDYSKTLSERLKHTRLSGGEDYCVICGAKEKLTFDHVPPKVATPFREIVQYHLLEVHDVEVNQRVQGVRSRNGSKFKTICKACNSLLGRYDDALGDLCKAASNGVHSYFTTASHISTTMFFKCDVKLVMRSVAGHMMSATSTEECQKPPSDHPFWRALSDFVLEGTDPSATHDFYCWFYPYKHSVSAKQVVFFNQGHLATVTVLAFYPIAFLVAEADKAIVPTHAHKVQLNGDGIWLDLDSRGFKFAQYPFHGLEGNQMVTFSSPRCIVSVPTNT